MGVVLELNNASVEWAVQRALGPDSPLKQGKYSLLASHPGFAEVIGRTAPQQFPNHFHREDDIWKRTVPIREFRRWEDYQQLLVIYEDTLNNIHRAALAANRCPQGCTKQKTWYDSQFAAAQKAVEEAKKMLLVAPVDVAVSLYLGVVPHRLIDFMRGMGIDEQHAQRFALLLRTIDLVGADPTRMITETFNTAAREIGLKRAHGTQLLSDVDFSRTVGGALGYGPRGWQSAAEIGRKYRVDRRSVTHEAEQVLRLMKEILPSGETLAVERFFSYHSPVQSYFLSPELARLVTRNFKLRRFSVPTPSYCSRISSYLQLPADVESIDRYVINPIRSEYRGSHPVVPPLRYPEEALVRCILPARYYVDERPKVSELEFVTARLKQGFAREIKREDEVTLPEYAREIGGELYCREALSLIHERHERWNRDNTDKISPRVGRRTGQLVPQDYYKTEDLKKIEGDVRKVIDAKKKIAELGLVTVASAARSRRQNPKTLLRELGASGTEVYYLHGFHMDRAYPYVKQSDLT